MNPNIACTIIACFTAVIISTEFAVIARVNFLEKKANESAKFLLLHPEIAHPHEPGFEITPESDMQREKM